MGKNNFHEPGVQNLSSLKADTLDQHRFPYKSRQWQKIEAELESRRGGCKDIAWNSTRNLKASYNAGDDVAKVSWNAYSKFQGDNLLYAGTLFPSLPEIAEDVVTMSLELMSAPEGAGGTITSGGTESILLAVRSAFKWMKEKRPVPGIPEIIGPYNLHPAFNKAADMMGIKVVRIPLKNFRGDPSAIAGAISENTFMLAGSAHAYPIGHIDPIDKLSEIADNHNLWLHVDACIGGFFLPFVADLGYSLPAWNFSVPGVISISADLHKYGFTARGASLLLLRDINLKRYHMFNFEDWPTGQFNTPTLTGSRPAGAIASAWAVFNYLGFTGYRNLTAQTLVAKQKMIEAVETIRGLHLCGNPEGGLIAFHGEADLDMMAIRDGMTARGWHTGVVIDPPGFQMILNHRSGDMVEEFVTELDKVVTLFREGKIKITGNDLSYGN